jgi:hypothetical protein
MAESSILWTTDGTGDGTNSGYTMAQLTEWMRLLVGINSTNLSGVAQDYLNELAVTGTSSPVAVNTGGAIVYGFPYFNSASVNVVVATPSVSTRVDVVVLEVDWTAQTVRIGLQAGTEGAGVPALTQTPSTTWQMPLANASITTGGVITLTDRRQWINAVGVGAVDSEEIADGAVDLVHMSANSVDSDQYVDGSIDLVHMSANSVDSDQYVDGSIDTAHIAADQITGALIADNQIDSEHYVDGSIDPAHLADDAVTAAKLAASAVDPRASIDGQNGIVIDPNNGNVRGVDAVDLQTTRSVASQVASGLEAVISGGKNNTVAGTDATVSGGIQNSASNSNSVVVGGSANTASGLASTVIGGATNIASGNYSVSSGNENIADKHGQVSFSPGRFAAQGDCQTSVFVVRNSTTNATPAELYTNGSSTRLTIASDTTWAFEALVVARRADADNESAMYKFHGCIDNNAGTTALVGSVVAETPIEDDADWACAITADDTNDALILTVTGEAAKTIYWVARVTTVEVTG